MKRPLLRLYNDLDDRETTIAVLNSQSKVSYKETTGLFRNIPLPEPSL